MEYEGIDSAICQAEESDWLDVSYTERKYVKPQKPQKKAKGVKVWKFAVVAVVCVAVLASLLFLDGDFKKDVFEAVRTATVSLFNRQESKSENKIDIPCNLTLVDVNDGVMTFCGGRAALSLTDGKVTEITEDSLTVALDDNTEIIYRGLTTMYVQVGDEIAADSLLGKYDGEFSVSILQKGEVVKQVVGSETQLTWDV